MSNHTYKIIELVGSSATSTDDAIHNAIERASKTLRNMDWFEVIETRGHLQDGKVAHFQVKLKIGIRLDDQHQQIVFKIYSAGNITDAYLLQSLLAEADIETQVLNEYSQGGVGELSFTHAYPELWLINAADIEQARGIITKFEQQDVPVGSTPCPNCAESNPNSFEICWRCQTEIMITTR